MKLLLRAAFQKKKHFYLILITLFSLCCLTVASSLEMFALGFITDTSSKFFSKESGKAESTSENKISKGRRYNAYNSTKNPSSLEKSSHKRIVNPLDMIMKKSQIEA